MASNGAKGAKVRWATGPGGGGALAERSQNAMNIAPHDDVVPCSPVGAPTPAEGAREPAMEIPAPSERRPRILPKPFSPAADAQAVRYNGIRRTVVKVRRFPDLRPEDEVPQADDGMSIVSNSKMSKLFPEIATWGLDPGGGAVWDYWDR